MLKSKRLSYIDKIRGDDLKNKRQIPLREDETIILQSQTIFKFGERSGWQPGHLYLTSQRLIFKQVVKIKLEAELENISQVKVGEGYFVGRKKKVLNLEIKNNLKNKNICILAEPFDPWLKRIREFSLKIHPQSLDEIFQKLDSESASILDYFLNHRYATILELSKFLGGMPHFKILKKIKEVINHQAEKTIGFPILEFKRLKFDSNSKKEISFSWWLIGEIKEERSKDYLLDIFDEGDYLSVIFEVPEDYTKDLKIETQNNFLSIHNKDYYAEVILPKEVSPQEFIKNYQNNILEIRLSKVNSSQLSAVSSQVDS